VTLNEKFRGTWVADGNKEDLTKGILARTLKQPDLVDEIISTDLKSDEWLKTIEKMHNQAWVLRDPPVNLGKYFNDFCRRNTNSYKDYKKLGINKIAEAEFERYKRKIEI